MVADRVAGQQFLHVGRAGRGGQHAEGVGDPDRLPPAEADVAGVVDGVTDRRTAGVERVDARVVDRPDVLDPEFGPQRARHPQVDPGADPLIDRHRVALGVLGVLAQGHHDAGRVVAGGGVGRHGEGERDGLHAARRQGEPVGGGLQPTARLGRGLAGREHVVAAGVGVEGVGGVELEGQRLVAVVGDRHLVLDDGSGRGGVGEGAAGVGLSVTGGLDTEGQRATRLPGARLPRGGRRRGAGIVRAGLPRAGPQGEQDCGQRPGQGRQEAVQRDTADSRHGRHILGR